VAYLDFSSKQEIIDHSMINYHVQFGFNQISGVWHGEIMFTIFPYQPRGLCVSTTLGVSLVQHGQHHYLIRFVIVCLYRYYLWRSSYQLQRVGMGIW
jgi:hypothetical protein